MLVEKRGVSVRSERKQGASVALGGMDLGLQLCAGDWRQFGRCQLMFKKEASVGSSDGGLG